VIRVLFGRFRQKEAVRFLVVENGVVYDGCGLFGESCILSEIGVVLKGIRDFELYLRLMGLKSIFFFGSICMVYCSIFTCSRPNSGAIS